MQVLVWSNSAYHVRAAMHSVQVRAIGAQSYASEYMFGRVSSGLGFACCPTALRYPDFRMSGFGITEELIVYSTTELSRK